MNLKKVFLTYPENSEVARSTAYRIQTLAHLYGFDISLPSRLNVGKFTQETINRIKDSDWVVGLYIFDDNVSNHYDNIFEEELEKAIYLNKTTYIITNKQKKEAIAQKYQNKNVFVLKFDYQNPDDILEELSKRLSHDLKPKNDNLEDALIFALFSLVAGLLVYWFISSLEEKA